jgi:hypothetical protein
MTIAHDDIGQIFDDYEKDRLSSWDIIDLFLHGRDMKQLLVILRERPHLASNILYMMTELTAEMTRPIWDEIAEFVASDQAYCAYYALLVMSGFLPSLGTEEASSLLGRVRVKDAVIEARVRDLKAALDARSTDRGP